MQGLKIQPSQNPLSMRQDRSSPLYTSSSPLSKLSSLSPVMNSGVTSTVQHSSTARPSKNTNSLRLANLGRYPHTNHKSVSAPVDDSSKLGIPVPSPKHHSQSRQYSDAQMALHNYQRELIANATRSSRNASTTITYEPLSPRLAPLGSPGPVTPMMLEDDGGYMVAGARPGMVLDDAGQRDFVDRLIYDENHRNDHQVERVSAVSPAGGNR